MLLRTGLLVLGAYQAALGGFMALAPGTFFAEVGPFGARNDHYVRDMASWELALAVAALVAVVRPRWRVPVLGLAALHYALHTLNHLLDVNEATPHSLGPATAISLGVGTVLVAGLCLLATRTSTESR
jgi:hypothetical protein